VTLKALLVGFNMRLSSPTLFSFFASCFILGSVHARPKSSGEKFLEEKAKELARKHGGQVDAPQVSLTPGSSALIPVNPTFLVKSPKAKNSFVYSVLGPSRHGEILSIIRSQGRTSFQVSLRNQSLNDPGYVTDPFWMYGENILAFKFGRFSHGDSYRLCYYDVKRNRVILISSRYLIDTKIYLSPDHRYLAFTAEDGTDTYEEHEGPRKSSLFVWDSVSKKTSTLFSGFVAEGSVVWKNDKEVVYSNIIKTGGVTRPRSFVWSMNKSKVVETYANSYSVLFSPDGRWMVFNGPRDNTRNYTQANSEYYLRKIGSKKEPEIITRFVGESSANRQLQWSSNSHLLYSVLNSSSSEKRTILAFNTSTKKVKSWGVTPSSAEAYLLSSSNESEAIYILVRSYADKVNPLGEPKQSVSLNVLEPSAGKYSTVFHRDDILGVDPNGILVCP
jgi:hypothetical protein